MEQKIKNNFHSYIYLIQEREFLNTNVFKIGKSRQETTKRVVSYPKGSKLVIMRESTDCDLHEKELLKIFKEDYKHLTQYGAEYFEGDRTLMIKSINSFLDASELALLTEDAQELPVVNAAAEKEIENENNDFEEIVNNFKKNLEDEYILDKIIKKKLENKTGYSLTFKEKRKCVGCGKEHGNQRLDIYEKEKVMYLTCYNNGVTKNLFEHLKEPEKILPEFEELLKVIEITENNEDFLTVKEVNEYINVFCNYNKGQIMNCENYLKGKVGEVRQYIVNGIPRKFYFGIKIKDEF